MKYRITGGAIIDDKTGRRVLWAGYGRKTGTSQRDDGRLRDVNGNTVGEYKITGRKARS